MPRVDGLWAAGLATRVRPVFGEPRFVDCSDEQQEPNTAAAELTLLWRRGKRFRRHRTYR